METIARRYRVAKKEHHCDFCRGRIAKGEKYSYSFIRDGGDNWSHKAHLECEFVANELWSWINPWDGMTEDDFMDGCNTFCRKFICPHCASWDDEYEECRNDESYCIDKIAAKLKEYDFCIVTPPESLKIPAGRRCWGFVKKETPVTELPRMI